MKNVKLDRDRNGRFRVWDIALGKWVWVQPVDARQGIERGQFAAEEPKQQQPARGGRASTASE